MPVAILASPSPDPRLAVPRFVCSARMLSQSSIGTGRLSKKKFYSKSSFKDVGASKELIAALKAINITQPSHIQALSFEALRTHPSSNLLLADQAGCGKTLAYLGPIVQQLREEEKNAGHRITQSKKPTGIIMVPTAELAGQVVSVARSLSKTAPFRCVALTGARGWRTQRTFLEEGVDVCVGTPQRLLDHVIAETMQLEKCRTLVLDEVDILLGDSFDFKDTVTEIRSCTPQGTQYILVTATIADDIYEDLNNLFPDLVPVIGPHLHQLTQGVTEQLVNCSGGDEINEETGQKRKLAALLSLIQHHKVGRTIIFCNKISTCRKVENFINRHFKDDHVWRVLPHHAAIDPEIRQRNLKDFLKPPGDCSLILVCTDRASRGLDTADVEHVILFDFPRDPSEYVRRVGRTARGPCSEGLVSVLVLGRQVSLAQQIIEKNKRGRPVHRIPSIKS